MGILQAHTDAIGCIGLIAPYALYEPAALTLFGATALATWLYLYMALTHWQMEVHALETLDMATGVKSSLSIYGWILVITLSGMCSYTGWSHTAVKGRWSPIATVSRSAWSAFFMGHGITYDRATFDTSTVDMDTQRTSICTTYYKPMGDLLTSVLNRVGL